MKQLLIWIGSTLELSALVAWVATWGIENPAADAVLLTFAVILVVNGLSLQLYSAGIRMSEESRR